MQNSKYFGFFCYILGSPGSFGLAQPSKDLWAGNKWKCLSVMNTDGQADGHHAHHAQATHACASQGSCVSQASWDLVLTDQALSPSGSGIKTLSLLCDSQQSSEQWQHCQTLLSPFLHAWRVVCSGWHRQSREHRMGTAFSCFGLCERSFVPHSD